MDKKTVAIFLIILLAACGRFISLGDHDLHPWDEPFYALRARAAAEDGAWLDQNDYCPHRMVNACYPPLFVWLTGAAMKVLGPTELAARLWAAVFGVGTVGVVFLFARRLFDDKAALFAAGALAVLPYFTSVSRMGQFDVPVAFFLTLTFWLWVEYLRTGRRSAAAATAVSFGLCLLTKIAVGFAFPVAAFSALIVMSIASREFRFRRFAVLALVTGAGIALALPWHIYMYAVHGGYFLRHFLGYAVFYSGEGLSPPSSPWGYLFYANYAVIFMAGLTPFLILSATRLLRERGTWVARQDRLILIAWAVLSLVVLTLMSVRREVYLVPVLPALCILAGPALASFGRGRARRGGVAAVAAAAVLAALWADNTFLRTPVLTLFRGDGFGVIADWYPVIVVIAAAAIAGILCFLAYRRFKKATVVVLLVLVLGHLGVGSVCVLGTGETDWQPLKPVLEECEYPGVVYVSEEDTPTHLFYLHRLLPGFGGAERVFINPSRGEVDTRKVAYKYRRGYLVILDKEAAPGPIDAVVSRLNDFGPPSAESERFILFADRALGSPGSD